MHGLATDVLVLGGGPAGLTAARACAARGVKTVLVEKKREIGSPIQSSGATWIEDVRRYGLPADFCHRVGTIRFLSPNREARFRNVGEGVAVLDVRGAYQYLAEAAVREGAGLLLGTRALAPVVREGSVCGAVVRTPRGREERLEARVTIDATGFASLTARHVLDFGGYRRYAVGWEYDLVAPGWPQEELVLLVGSDVAPTGYAWIFPWGGVSGFGPGSA